MKYTASISYVSDTNMSAILKGMALFVRQDENRSELQQRLAEELREKARKRAEDKGERPDGVEDSNYLKDTKTTTSLAWVWAIIALAAIAIILFFIIKNVSH